MSATNATRFRRKIAWVTIGDRQEAELFIDDSRRQPPHRRLLLRIIADTNLHPDRWSWEIWDVTTELHNTIATGVIRGTTGRERAVTAIRDRLGALIQEATDAS
jgi:hypothetical protein